MNLSPINDILKEGLDKKFPQLPGSRGHFISVKHDLRETAVSGRASYYVVVPLFMLVFDLISIIDPYYPWLYSLVPKEDC